MCDCECKTSNKIEIDYYQDTNTQVHHNIHTKHKAHSISTRRRDRRRVIAKAIADSGATGNFLTIGDQHALQDLKPHTTTQVHLPDGTTIQSSHQGTLNICNRQLPALVFPALHCGSLISIGSLCDAGLTVTFTSTDIKVIEPATNQSVSVGTRDASNGLWHLSLENATPTDTVSPSASPAHTAANAIEFRNVRQITAFWKATFGSPTDDTLTKAIDKGFIIIPGLTSKRVRKHPTHSKATARGHLDQHRQGYRSTKPLSQPVSDKPPSPSGGSTYVQSRDMRETNHSDLTGRLPVTSQRGNNYLLIMYNEDSEYIHAEPMPNRSQGEYIKAYSRGYEFFNARGIHPRFEHMDNEASDALKVHLRDKLKVIYQLAAPGMHRTNHAERCIRTFKNHFISTLATTDHAFPLFLWDLLLPHAELTLNLLRESRTQPDISAWGHLHTSTYDFSAHPLAPAGIAIHSHVKPHARTSWGIHGDAGFYLGPAPDSYRCHRVWVTDTLSERITDTVEWHPTDAMFPGSSPLDLLTTAYNDLERAVRALQHTLGETAVEVPDSMRDILAELTRTFTSPALRAEANPPADLPAAAEQRVPPAIAAHRVHPAAADQRVAPVEAHPIAAAPLDATVPLPAPTAAAEQRVRPEAGAPAPVPLPPVPTRTTYPRHSRSRRPARYQANLAVDRQIAKHALPAFLGTATTIDDSGVPLTYHTAIKGPDREHWIKGHSAEFRRLVTLTKTMRFIRSYQIPKGRKASYYNPQVRLKQKPTGPEYRVRGTYGGDRSDYTGAVAAATADMQTLKLMLNAVVSEDAEYMTADITDFYLGTPLRRPEYMRINVKHIPEDIMTEYNLHSLVHNGHVLVEINKGIYGLPQAGKLAQERLVAHLATAGYHQTPNTPCLFRHETRNIAFTLVVDDFGIKYVAREDAEHLLSTLRQLYTITVDWAGSKYLGLTITRDRIARTLTLNLPK
jgi:hypothetical protein